MKQINNKPSQIDRHIIFAEEYIACNRNATMAYKKVYGEGLSDETAAVNASKLLRITKVKVYLQRRFDSLQLDSTYVLQNFKKLAETAKQESSRVQANIWIGKAIGMFSDNYMTHDDYEIENEEEKIRKKEESMEQVSEIFRRFGCSSSKDK